MKFCQSAIEMFEQVDFGDGRSPEFPIDLIAPGESQVVTCQLSSDRKIITSSTTNGFVCVDIGVIEDDRKTCATYFLERLSEKARVANTIDKIAPKRRRSNTTRKSTQWSGMRAFRLSDGRVLCGPDDVFAMPCRRGLAGFVALDISDVVVISSDILIADVLFRLLDDDLRKQMSSKLGVDFSLAECSSWHGGCPVFYDETTHKQRATGYYCWTDAWRPIIGHGQVRFEQRFQIAASTMIPVITTPIIRNLIEEKFIEKYEVDGRQYQLSPGEAYQCQSI